MRIMIDTNIFIPTLVFGSKYLRDMLNVVLKNHIMVLSTYGIAELENTVKTKFPQKSHLVEIFLQKISFEVVVTPEKIVKDEFPNIRDVKDLPILVSAILSDIDILITNDKDFKAVDIDRPEILEPKEFLERYK